MTRQTPFGRGSDLLGLGSTSWQPLRELKPQSLRRSVCVLCRRSSVAGLCLLLQHVDTITSSDLAGDEAMSCCARTLDSSRQTRRRANLTAALAAQPPRDFQEPK